MKIGIQTWGSQGDIFPFICLAKGLRDAGHEVTLAYTSIENKDYSNQSSGFKLVNVFDKYEDIDSLIPNAINKKSTIQQLKYLMDYAFDPAESEMYEASKKLCQENDLVIHHAIVHTLHTAAEKYQCPRIPVTLTSNVIYSKYASCYGTNLGRLLNLLSWKLADYFSARILFKTAAQLREREGLPKIRRISQEVTQSNDLTLVATSQTLTKPLKDWRPEVKVCGFWGAKVDLATWIIPDKLKTFLSAGSPPIFYTFGSMGDLTPQATVQLFKASAERSGHRAIIQTPLYQEFEQYNNEQVLFVGSLPHHQVFPQCQAIVHHGGAGTTQATLASGKPSIIVGFGFDQSYWGRVLKGIGVTNKVLRRKSATPDSIAKQVKKIAGDKTFSDKAAQVGKQLKREDGVKNAVQLIEAAFA